MSGSPFILALRTLIGVSRSLGIIQSVSVFLATSSTRIGHVALKFLR